METMLPVVEETVSNGEVDKEIEFDSASSRSSGESTFDSQEDDSSSCCSSSSSEYSDTASITDSVDDENMYPEQSQPLLFGLKGQPTEKTMDNEALGLVMTMEQVLSLRQACSSKTPTMSNKKSFLPEKQLQQQERSPTSVAPPPQVLNVPSSPTDEPMPRQVLESILRKHYGQQRGYNVTSSSSYKLLSTITSYFVQQHVDVTAYNEFRKAANENDCARIKELSSMGKTMNIQSCNKFGESVFHAAAKQGQTHVLETLVLECGGSLRVCCDTGRNPLHDACWTTTPNFTCIRFILQQARELLWIRDKKNGTPLEYVPASAAAVWNAFLEENVELLVPERVGI